MKVISAATLTVLMLLVFVLPPVSASESEAFLLTGPVATDLAGTELKQVQAGHQVMLKTTLKNIRSIPFDEPVAVIIDMRDSDGFTVFLSWQTVEVAPGEIGASNISWLVPSTAQQDDAYEIRVFVLSSLIEPTALTAVYTRYVHVV